MARRSGRSRGDVTGSHVVWANTDKVYVPSSLLIDGRLVCVKDIGVAVCSDARSGKQLWEERLGAGEFSASPVALEDLVFVPNEAGRMYWVPIESKLPRSLA